LDGIEGNIGVLKKLVVAIQSKTRKVTSQSYPIFMRQFDKATVVDEELHDLKLRFELLGKSILISRG
jgi:hypothetical protein